MSNGSIYTNYTNYTNFISADFSKSVVSNEEMDRGDRYGLLYPSLSLVGEMYFLINSQIA